MRRATRVERMEWVTMESSIGRLMGRSCEPEQEQLLSNGNPYIGVV
jgi:hypothetical protein